MSKKRVKTPTYQTTPKQVELNKVIQGTTKRGYEFAIDSRIMKDYRFVELIGAVNNTSEEEQVSKLTQLVDLLFRSKEKKEEFLTFLSDEDGFVDSTIVIEEVADIFSKMGSDIKNS